MRIYLDTTIQELFDGKQISARTYNCLRYTGMAPLPAEATTSLLLIAFIGYLFCYDFSASRHFIDEEHWLTAIAPFILTVQS